MATPATPYTDVLWPAASYDEYTWTWRPLSDPTPDGYFWAHQLGISNGTTNGPGGYAGAQTLGSGLGGKAVVWSLAGSMVSAATILAPAGTASVVTADFDGGPGYSTRIAYNWQTGRTYNWRVWRDRVAGGTAWWRASITDTTTNVTTVISEIGVASQWTQLNGYSILWTERYSGPAAACEDFQRALAEFGSLRANGIAPASVNTTLGGGTCVNSSFADSAAGVRQVVGSTSLGFARVELAVGATTLTEPFDVEWNDTLNRLGGFSFSLLNDDPQRSLCTLGAMVTISKDGTECFYGRIEGIRQVDAAGDEIGRTIYGGRRSIAELERVRVFPPYWPAAGAGQAAGRDVAIKPWDSVRVFGWPDPPRGFEISQSADGADNVTIITAQRPEGWPDPEAYWIGEATGAAEAYFFGVVQAEDAVGKSATIWCAFQDEGELYFQGTLIKAVTATEADPNKCYRITTEITPGIPNVFAARVRRLTSANALFSFCTHWPESDDPKFLMRTAGPFNDWAMAADPALPPATTPGEIVLDILNEFAGRSGASLGWTATFTASTDSAGNPWPAIPIFPVNVGDSLVDVLERLADAWVEWGTEVDTTTRTLSMWNAPGVALPNNTAGVGRGSASGVTLAVGTNVLELVHEVTE